MIIEKNKNKFAFFISLTNVACNDFKFPVIRLIYIIDKIEWLRIKVHHSKKKNILTKKNANMNYEIVM